LASKPDRVLVGDIGRAQGLKGEVRIRSFTQEPSAIASYGPLEDETASRLFEFEGLRADGKGLIASIKGVTTREGAEALTGTKLYLPRDRLPERGEEEWYHADLVGLTALDPDGKTLGTVTAVHNFGAGDVIEVSPEGGGPELLVAFTDANVPEVNVPEGWIRVVPPVVIE
jgi:16S rRNA processing protein RimM